MGPIGHIPGREPYLFAAGGPESSQGLGLTNVKRFVEAIGDRLWVESEKGLGAAFFFTLPKTGL